VRFNDSANETDKENEMIRPTWIAALDTTLDESMIRCDETDAAVRGFLAKHIRVIDEYKALCMARANAYGDVRNTEDAIRRLGYVVMDGTRGVPLNDSRLGDRQYSATSDEWAAREALSGEGEAK